MLDISLLPQSASHYYPFGDIHCAYLEFTNIIMNLVEVHLSTACIYMWHCKNNL